MCSVDTPATTCTGVVPEGGPFESGFQAWTRTPASGCPVESVIRPDTDPAAVRVLTLTRR